MYINNSYTPVLGPDHKTKKYVDLHRQSINSNLTTNIGETHDANSQSSILLNTFDDRGRKFKKDFSSCKHLEHTQSSKVSNIGKISSRSNRLNEF